MSVTQLRMSERQYTKLTNNAKLNPDKDAVTQLRMIERQYEAETLKVQQVF